jgi:phenylacetate-coenzyme A ligase PaaK-like adenylate-forming protein
MAAGLSERYVQYAQSLEPGSRRAIQLNLWNEEWRRIIGIPHYKRMAAECHLPATFESWDQFVKSVPPTTRRTIQQFKADMTDTSRPPDFFRMTGGSTAEPIQIPAWKVEAASTQYDMWLARSWYGIAPESRLFMLWGHSHLLGTGLRGWWNGQQRKLRDRLLGYHRYSAYDLKPEALSQAAIEMIRFRPDYIIGYSVALDRFARINAGLSSELRALRVKAVIGAAEAFPSDDSTHRLENLFSAPVVMEYGSVETNLVAHMHPAGGYRVFWRNYFVEAEETGSAPNSRRIRVTSLFPRCFPLVRYELGDEIELCGLSRECPSGLACFARVVGRCNDYVTLSDGSCIHSEVFSHVVRPHREIAGYQVIQEGAQISLNLLCPGGLPASVTAAITERLSKINPGLQECRLVRAEEFEQTLAGKTRMVIRR